MKCVLLSGYLNEISWKTYTYIILFTPQGKKIRSTKLQNISSKLFFSNTPIFRNYESLQKKFWLSLNSPETGESPSIFLSILFVELEISESNLSLNLAAYSVVELLRTRIFLRKQASQLGFLRHKESILTVA